MRKKATRWILIILGILVYVWIGAGIYGMYQIEHFSPLTFEKILSSEKRLKSYGIQPAEKDPSAFGIKNFQEVEFTSHPDGLRLSAWYIPPAQNSRECVVFLHGRPANRLRLIKYLRIYRDAGLTKRYCLFFLDFRNSGKSEPASTALGFEFAEDIASALEFLQKKYKHDRFVIHAFSTGAMATGLFFHRPELQKRIAMHKIKIKGLIFDSPLSNIVESYHLAAKRRFGLPRFALAGGILFFGLHQPFSLDEMRLSRVARDYHDLPVLILQGEKDDTTPASVLRAELKKLGKDGANIRVHYFPDGEHVQIYQNPAYAQEYVEQIVGFMNHLHERRP